MKKATPSISQSSTRSMKENLSKRSIVEESSDSKAPSISLTKMECTYNHSHTHSKHQTNYSTTISTTNNSSSSTKFMANEMSHRTPLGAMNPNMIASRATSGGRGRLKNARPQTKKKNLQTRCISPCVSSVRATPIQEDKDSVPTMSFKTPPTEKETFDSNTMPPLLVRQTENFGTNSQFGAWGIFIDEESESAEEEFTESLLVLRDDNGAEERCPASQEEQEAEHFYMPIYPSSSRSMRGAPPSIPSLDRISPMNEESVFRLEPRRRGMFSNV